MKHHHLHNLRVGLLLGSQGCTAVHVHGGGQVAVPHQLFLNPDGHGLFLYVTPAGGKYWRWQFRFQGKAQSLSVGEYPLMSLKEARTEHQRWQDVLQGGVNPADQRKRDRKAEAALTKLRLERSALAKIKPLEGPIEKVVDWPEGSFGAVQTEWFKKWSNEKSPRHRDQMESRLKADILPKLGHRHIMDIEAPEIANMAKAIDSRGAGELARRALFFTINKALQNDLVESSAPRIFFGLWAYRFCFSVDLSC